LKTITAEYNSFCDEPTGVVMNRPRDETTGDELTGHHLF